MFKSGISLFSAVPMIEVAAIYVLQTIYRYSTEEAEKRHIRRAFQFYLNKSVIEEMLQDPSKLKLGGDKKVLSVMFSDIRGFTTISEKLTPEGLAKLINEYLTPMTNLVFETGGTLDKYIGDALMAIWGAPLDQPDHAYRACKTAVAMMRQLALLQQQWKDQGLNYPPIDIGIGINSGPMVVGNMGADQRFDYTVLGDNVNLASRLEGTNKDYRSHIIISQNTYDLCKGQIAAMQLGAVRVKGKKEPVAIYELHDDKPATGELAEVIALFDKAVALFQEQRWEACREQCRAVLARWPDYGPPHAYIEFCDEYEKHPPGTQWDGVYTMMHK
jgi:adenylate cyclase